MSARIQGPHLTTAKTIRLSPSLLVLGEEGRVTKSQTYRAFVARPTHILDTNGELLEAPSILKLLASEIRDVSGYATYAARNDVVLGERLATVTVSAPADAGRRAGVTMPDFLATGRTGKSRKERLVQYNVVTAYRSWQERVKAANGDSSKYVSQGWKRTASATAPTYGGDYVNLGAVDKQYAVIENDPFASGEIVLRWLFRGDGIGWSLTSITRGSPRGRLPCLSSVFRTASLFSYSRS